MSAIATAMQRPRQSIARIVKEHGLLDLAASLAVEANVPGPRASCTDRYEAQARDRDYILTVLAEAGSYREAALPPHGIPISTMVRRVYNYGISSEEIEERRAEIAAARRHPRKSR